MIPLARQSRSGATPSCSQANIVPVRPKPVATSSQISSTPWRVAELADRAQVAGRLDQDPGRALDQRLDDHRRDLVAVGGEQRARASAASPARDGVGLEQQRPVGGVEEVDAADRDRADRVAVVGLAELDEGGAAGVLAAALGLVLEGHLQRDLDRGRAGVRVEDAGEAGRGDLDQARRPARRRRGGRGRAWSSGRRGRAARSTAASISGWRWPWTLHQSEEMPSR